MASVSDSNIHTITITPLNEPWPLKFEVSRAEDWDTARECVLAGIDRYKRIPIKCEVRDHSGAIVKRVT